ncbi:hypothetical protein PoB_001931300 [Plakobranchus ocellatus]|uniref:ZP domain-containing protein n=1 Tax=Plakobranchus ocellatus TaxID=259542 RepID=A0AAV3ZDJ7_9GAST|nr:hypothetical protein PoB_001931300 [Plakobranchus ocellatus]
MSSTGDLSPRRHCCDVSVTLKMAGLTFKPNARGFSVFSKRHCSQLVIHANSSSRLQLIFDHCSADVNHTSPVKSRFVSNYPQCRGEGANLCGFSMWKSVSSLLSSAAL